MKTRTMSMAGYAARPWHMLPLAAVLLTLAQGPAEANSVFRQFLPFLTPKPVPAQIQPNTAPTTEFSKPAITDNKQAD